MANITDEHVDIPQSHQKLTFKGLGWRVQLCVWDLTGKYGNGKLNFSVFKLPAEAHAATAFSTGIALYYGPSLLAAIAAVRQTVGLVPTLPSSWNRYGACFFVN